MNVTTEVDSIMFRMVRHCFVEFQYFLRFLALKFETVSTARSWSRPNEVFRISCSHTEILIAVGYDWLSEMELGPKNVRSRETHGACLRSENPTWDTPTTLHDSTNN